MTRDFSEESLRQALVGGYGISVRTLEALKGRAHSLNFRAETMDGTVFEVKCFPTARKELLERLLAHTVPSDNPLAATRIFGGKVVTLDGWTVMALRWVHGYGRDPDELSDGEMAAFLSAHAKFLGSLADDGAIMPVRDGFAVKRLLLERLSGGNAPEILRELEALPDESLTLEPERVRIIHGDLHRGNFRFENGTVSGFFDLEELRFGTPAEDLVRYVVCCAERQRWYDLSGRRRLLSAFRRILAGTSYSRDEWMFAVNGYLLRKLAKKVRSNRLSLPRRINLRARFGFYRALRMAVEKEETNV